MQIPKRVLLISGTFCLTVLLYVDRICISAAKEPIVRDLSLTDTQMGWVLSAFALGYALFQTPGGFLSDQFGPRIVLSSVVVFWSAFTGLTAAARGFVTLLVARFLFGAGEAGAFPGLARAVYSWIPMSERGIMQAINFSGTRIGAAVAFPAIAWLIGVMGWRPTFVVLMAVGFVWAIFWYRWFRDDPTEHKTISPEEVEYILASRQPSADTIEPRTFSTPMDLARSPSIWLVSAQYFASNFTFFFCLSWLLPHLKERFELSLVEAAIYSSAPLYCGALGNWFSGWMVDRIYKANHWTSSRRIPAIIGFVLAAAGTTASAFVNEPLGFIICFSLAIFGADMTLPPSWSFCIDIGRRQSGVVSGTMNMAGNLGSFLTALAFPYLAAWTASDQAFFFAATSLNVAAAIMWMFMSPTQRLKETV